MNKLDIDRVLANFIGQFKLVIVQVILFTDWEVAVVAQIDRVFCYYNDLPASSNSGAVSYHNIIELHRLLPR